MSDLPISPSMAARRLTMLPRPDLPPMLERVTEGFDIVLGRPGRAVLSDDLAAWDGLPARVREVLFEAPGRVLAEPVAALVRYQGEALAIDRVTALCRHVMPNWQPRSRRGAAVKRRRRYV